MPGKLTLLCLVCGGGLGVAAEAGGQAALARDTAAAGAVKLKAR